jgi:hypothetical protein
MTTLAERNRGLPQALLAAAFGLVAGLGIYLLTSALSTSDIGGQHWSLRGNGALIVLFTLAPAVLAAGWIFLADRGLTATVASFVTTAGLALAFGTLPIALGPADPEASIKAALAIAIAALPVGVALAGGKSVIAAAMATALMVVITVAPTGAGYLLMPILLPLVIAMPSFAQKWSANLAASALALALGIIFGSIGGQYLLAAA